MTEKVFLSHEHIIIARRRQVVIIRTVKFIKRLKKHKVGSLTYPYGRYPGGWGPRGTGG